MSTTADTRTVTAGVSEDIYTYQVTIPFILSYVVGGLGVVANVFVLVVLLGFAKLKTLPNTALMINQTVTDAVCSALLLLTNLLIMTTDGKLRGLWGEIICRTILCEHLFWTSFVASTLSLVSITLERYLVVIHPIFHRNRYTRKVGLVFIAMGWLLAVVFMFPLTLFYKVDHGHCVPDFFGTFGTVFAASAFLGTSALPSVFLAFAYGRMIWCLLKRNKVSCHQESGTANKANMQ